MNTLAMRIEEVRLERGLKKTDVWKRAGLSSGAYSHWMNGGALTGENLIKVARILEVNPIWLETGKGSKELNVVAQQIAGYHQLDPDKMHQVPVVGKGMGGCRNECLRTRAAQQMDMMNIRKSIPLISLHFWLK